MSNETGDNLRRNASREGARRAVASIGKSVLSSIPRFSTPLGLTDPLAAAERDRKEQERIDGRIKEIALMIQTAEVLGFIEPVDVAPREVDYRDAAMLSDPTAPDVKSWE